MPVVFWIFLVRLSFFELFGVVLEDDGVCKSDFKIYLPIGFDILGIHCRPFKKYHYSDPVRTNACAVYDPVCCLFAVARVGLGGPNLVRTSRDIARGSRRASNSPTYLPRAVVERMILFTHDVSLHLPVQTQVSNALCHCGSSI